MKLINYAYFNEAEPLTKERQPSRARRDHDDNDEDDDDEFPDRPSQRYENSTFSIF